MNILRLDTPDLEQIDIARMDARDERPDAVDLQEPASITSGPVRSSEPTAAQYAYLRDLLEKREIPAEVLAVVDSARDLWRIGKLTRYAVSAMIDTLKRYPAKANHPVDLYALDEGVYIGENGQFYAIRTARESQRRYVRRWNEADQEWVKCGVWELRGVRAVTEKEAAEFGHAFGQCVFCGRLLTDPRSVSVGFGPVCADNHDLTWGN